MKRFLLVVNLVFLAGLSSLLLVGCNEKAGTGAYVDTPAGNGSISKGDVFPIAYIDTDSLLRQYQFAIYLQEELLKKEEKSRTDFNEQAKKLQTQMAEFQRKVQNNGFLSRERAEQEQKNLMAKDQELQGLNAKLSNELMVEQEKLNRQLRDTLSSYLEEFNKDGKYKLILSNTLGDNVLYSAPGINITQEIADALNARYEAGKSK
ncbi:OmpH family outer membrane protein [Plebeiibacterium sediminum]|uniref:OmpH family outer membrane protein n=1 Tax=Plebeiibacterium sediminum TaxID=2992112 RepID=A0AAE3SHM4_9BACT|nr:OmpH family outer membrane protein [Plebeiobacterium sediminum]MCW3788268.1 OmpH family outer membrane protein [Plebeiobacterium sediminum]